jgi:uncharacterized protein (TIGR03437 family)
MVQRMRALYPHSFRFPVILSLALLSVLGRIDTAKAQQGQDSLLIGGSSNCSNNVCNFSAALGGPLQTTTLAVTSSAASLNFSVTQSQGQSWLAAYTSSSTSTPSSVTINVNPSFPAALGIGTYTGTVTLTPSGASTTPVIITVNLVVAATTSISISPLSFNFTSTMGSTSPTAPQALAVTSATNGIAYNETIGYGQSNVPAWLTVAPTFGMTPANLAVTANPSGLATGTYTATITVTTGQGSSQVANVTFTITGLPTLTPSLTSIPFFYQIGQSQTFDSSTFLTISSGNNSANVPFSLSVATTSCPGFFGVSSQPGTTLTTPATIQVSATGLSTINQPTTCNGSITITSSSTTNPSITIPVTLTVSNSPLLAITPPSASFTYQLGATTPANQNLTIFSSTTGLPFTASSNQSWLSVTPSGTTSTTSQISLGLVQSQLTNLIPNTYTATVTVVAPGASNSPLNIPVTLTVSGSSMLTITPPFANFVYEAGQQLSLNSQQITIGTTGGQVPFTISVPSTTGTQFITVSPLSGVAPATVTLTATPGTLSPSVYTTLIGVTPSDGSSATQNITAQLSISGAGQPQLNVSSPTLAFNYAPGQTVTAQTEFLTSTDPTIPLTVSNVTVNSSWLTTSFAPNSNLPTPQNLQVTVNPVFLTPSVTPYTANLTITTTTPQGATATTTIPVTLLYTSGITLTSTPTSLTFSQVTNGATPAAQTVSIGGTGSTGISFSTTASTLSGGTWLSVTPSTGTAPGTISIGITSVGASLAAGTYSGSVVVYGAGAANPTLTIPVTLNVTASPTLTLSVSGLTLSGTVAGTNPTAQTVQVTAPGAINSVTFSTAVATTSGGNWLTVSGAGATPSTLTVGANLAGLAAGSYTGTITLTPSGGAAPSVINVSLTVAAQLAPALTSVINAASGATGNVSPGEIVSIFGSGLGPISPAGLTLNAQGNVSTTLGGVTVSFNGIAAPLTYVSSTQINAVVPFEVQNVATAQLQISYNGIVSPATPVTIQATTPGVFTQGSTGTGLGAILKPDYSTVTASNAAPRGSTIIIYATGGGLTTPSSVSGAVAGNTLLKTNANVTVTIGGIAATVTYAGSAPGLVEGALQINAVVPTGISAGSQPILVTAGSATSQNGVTVPVQ